MQPLIGRPCGRAPRPPSQCKKSAEGLVDGRHRLLTRASAPGSIHNQVAMPPEVVQWYLHDTEDRTLVRSLTVLFYQMARRTTVAFHLKTWP